MTQPPFIQSINIAMIGALVPFIDKYPVLKKVLNESNSKDPSGSWDIFMTVAGVGNYLLTQKVTTEKRKEIVNELAAFHKQGAAVLQDFNEFVEKNKGDLSVKTAAGLWVLWNIKGSQPTHTESKELAPALGAYLHKVVDDLLD